jgi:hypothetical protein
MKFKLDMNTNEGWDQFDGFWGLVSFRRAKGAASAITGWVRIRGTPTQVLTGETNERSPLSELLHDELPGKQGVSIAFSPVDDEVEWMIIHEEFPPVDPGVVSEIERQATVCEMGLGEILFAGAKVVSKAGEVDVNLLSAVRQA